MLNNELFELGKKYQTDKVTHFFLHHYDNAFNHLRDKHLRLLEIGVYKGSSIRMWRDYFPNAEIHCIDINHVDLSDLKNVTMHIANCDSKLELKNLASKLGEFDIIIDDGGHSMKQQQNAFEIFWKNLKSKGTFVMEDLHTSINFLYPGHNEEKQPTTYDLLMSLLKKESFFSNYISKESYEDLSKTVDKVDIIWSKKIISNDKLKPFNASITSFITKE